MSEEQLKAFWEAIQADTSLQEKVRAATDADSIVSVAKEAGLRLLLKRSRKLKLSCQMNSLEELLVVSLSCVIRAGLIR